jgi:chromosome segregation and condensation protein ScpB
LEENDSKPEAAPVESEAIEPSVLPPQEIRAVLEALVFAAPQPITPREIAKVMGGVPKEAWQAALEEIRVDYGRDGRGLQLVEVAGGYQRPWR